MRRDTSRLLVDREITNPGYEIQHHTSQVVSILPAGNPLSFMMITVERSVFNEDGGSDRMYGFPLAYITGNVGCTGYYNVFFGPLIVDLAVYLAFILLLVAGIKRLGIAFKTHWTLTLLGILVTCFWVWVFCVVTADSHFQFKEQKPYSKTISSKVIFSLP